MLFCLSKSFMNLFKKILLSTISILVFQDCLYTRIANQFEKSLQENRPEKIRLMFLIKGNACVEICSSKDKSPVCIGKPENSCKNYAFGWYPVEFSRDEKYFLNSSFYPPKKIKLIQNLPPLLLRKYGENIHSKLQYVPVQSIEEIAKSYPKGKFKNALIVKLKDFGRDTHWSGIVSFATLLLFPGFYEEYIDMEINFFDNDGKFTKIDSNLPYLKHWMGWIFFLWGPIASAKEKDLITDSIEALIRK